MFQEMLSAENPHNPMWQSEAWDCLQPTHLVLLIECLDNKAL